ncbi:MAG TPA: response regulator, partial [Blastocatellia bacterium]|nr:response regulator [Blastocatellia bacterium]
GIELVCDIDSETPDALIGDPNRLRQILVNLLGNAIKFTDHGEIVAGVRIESKTGREVCLHFRVSDTGIGIPLDRQARIFEAFEQADRSTTRKYGGTGLGLAISCQLVEMMGGKIWLESEEGRGSTFHFTSTFILDESAPEIAPPLPPVEIRGSRVLAVDDNANNRRILTAIFAGWGIPIETLETGNLAIPAMREATGRGEPFRLVLMDDQLPDLDGRAVAEQIRQDKSLADAAVIMLTSATRKREGRPGQPDDSAHLTKPFLQSELVEVLRSIFGAAGGGGKSAAPAHRAQKREGGLRVLLAEDNKVNQRLGVKLLEKRGHTAVVANNGKEALDACSRDSFDVILMDVHMPEVNGFEATAAIREKEKGTGMHIPIIAMTASAMLGDKEECLESGMDGYVSKPVRADELYELLDRLAAAVEGRTGSKETAPERKTSETGASEQERHIDREAILNQVEGDEELLQELIESFLGSYKPHLTRIELAIANSDAGALSSAAHELGGAISIFHAKAAREALLSLEQMGIRTQISHAGEAMAQLKKEIEPLIRELTGMVIHV